MSLFKLTLRAALIAGVSLTAAACAVGPNYKAPATPPAAFQNADPAVFTAANPEAEWWKAFGDPVLDQLVGQALGGGGLVNYSSDFNLLSLDAAGAGFARQTSPAAPQAFPEMWITSTLVYNNLAASGGGVVVAPAGGGATISRVTASAASNSARSLSERRLRSIVFNVSRRSSTVADVTAERLA